MDDQKEKKEMKKWNGELMRKKFRTRAGGREQGDGDRGTVGRREQGRGLLPRK